MTDVINIEYIDQITEKINFASTCEELAEIKAEVIAFIQGQMDSVNEEIGKITALLTPPSGDDEGEQISSIISWITTYINLLTSGYLIMQAQLVAYAAKLAEIQASLISKSSELNCI